MRRSLRRVILWGTVGCGLLVPASAQRSANWRMFKAGDGMFESFSTAVTVSPGGRVWVRHGDAAQISVLDGFQIQTMPAPGPENYRVYESRTRQWWSL